MRRGKRREFLGLVLLDGGGVLRAHQKVRARRARARSRAALSRPRSASSIALARVPLGTAPGDTVHVQVRDKELAARVVKAPFVRNGKNPRQLKREDP